MIKKIIIFSFFCLISISLFAVFFGLDCNKAMALTMEKVDGTSNVCYNPVLKINKSNDRYSIACYDYYLKKIKYGTLDVNGQLYFETIDPDASYDVISDTYGHSLDLDSNGYPHISYIDTTSYYLHYAYQDISGWHSEIVDLDNANVRYNSIAIDSNGYPHIAYTKYYIPLSYQYYLMYAYKDINGWHTQTLDNTVNAYHPSIVLDNLNYAHISYYDNTNYDLEYAYQDINGWHKETVDSVGSVGTLSSIAIDLLNRPHISYYDGTNYDLKYALKDSGVWATETVDSSSANIGQYTSIVTDNSNRPHISYYDNTNADLKYTYKDSGAWNPTIVNTNCNSSRTSIDLTSTDLPQIGYTYSSNIYRAYYNGAWNSNQLKYFNYANKVIIDNNDEVRISSSGMSFVGYGYMDDDRWNTTLLDNTSSTPYGTDIAIDQNNYAHISYHYTGVNDLKYAYQDASGWHLETVDSVNDTGYFSSIAIDQNNYPHISYYYSTSGQVKHAYKDGAGWHTETIGSIGGYYGYNMQSSIKINSNNYPCVSYYDYTNTNLMYAYKDGTGWHTEIADSSGSVGEYNSLDLDSSNYPHIAYYDATNFKVKYAYKNIDGWHTEFVDANASYGSYITLKLNSSNIPNISYYNSATNFLNFAYKENSWVVQAVNEISYFGQYPSLALDNDDNVHMVGYSSTSIPPFYSSVVYHIFGSAPTSTSIAINSGASYTNTTAVTLNLSASSDAYQMMVSESATFVGASWETYATSKNFTLSSGDGTKTVYVKYRDKLLSESTGISSTIILDETKPTVTSAIAVPNPAKPGNVTVSLVFSETMDTTVSPTVNITGLVSSPYLVAQTSYGNLWTGTFALLDDDEIETAVISVADAKDLAGNTMLADLSAGTFEVNTIAPYLTSIIVNPNPAIPGTVGVILYFSQAMDTTVTPTVTINGLTNSYTVSQNIYGSAIWYGTFTLNPDNEDATATISVTGAKDIAGNTMLPDLTASTFQVESILPTISSISYTPNPAQAGLVTVTIVFSENMLTTALPVVEITGLRTENYGVVQTSYSGKTWTGNIVLDSSYTNTSGYISVRNAKDLAGNTMISQPEATTFTALNSMATDFNQTLNLEQTNLLRTYQDLGQDIKVYFYEKPSNSTGLYLTLIRKNKKYSSRHFIKKKLYPSYLILKSNIKNIRKTTFKITFHYKTKKLKKNKLKEKNLRLFIKDRDNKWRGPFTIYQNKEKNILKFKIRNYYLRPTSIAKTKKGSNQNFAPIYHFTSLSKAKFVIADKDAFQL
ncbi:MAG: Ig-like domain-containing protein [Patescibacteria group bacterium]|nr:Ig-like domain-containing protein [Patescibacteria group bacterium]